MPAQVTAATIPILRQAQGYFETAKANLDQIANAVFDSKDQLLSNGMISTASVAWGGAINQWNEDFNNIITVLNQMAEQLGNTASQIERNEQNNIDLASGLPAADQ